MFTGCLSLSAPSLSSASSSSPSSSSSSPSPSSASSSSRGRKRQATSEHGPWARRGGGGPGLEEVEEEEGHLIKHVVGVFLDEFHRVLHGLRGVTKCLVLLAWPSSSSSLTVVVVVVAVVFRGNFCPPPWGQKFPHRLDVVVAVVVVAVAVVVVVAAAHGP